MSLDTLGSQGAPRGAAPPSWQAATTGQQAPQVSGSDCEALKVFVTHRRSCSSSRSTTSKGCFVYLMRVGSQKQLSNTRGNRVAPLFTELPRALSRTRGRLLLRSAEPRSKGGRPR